MQNKIETWCNKNADKVLHFIIGILSAQLAYLWIWLILLPIVIGIGKEVYDKYVRQTGFNWWDVLATALGVVPVIVVILIKYFVILP